MPDGSLLRIDPEKIFGCSFDKEFKEQLKIYPPDPIRKYPFFHGEFKDGVPWNGIQYEYDTNKLLVRIYKIKEGLNVGDLPLPEDEKKNNCNCEEGYNKRYNSKKQIEADGSFNKCCQLINGKKYIYDENDKLMKIEIYKNGKYAGDGQMD